VGRGLRELRGFAGVGRADTIPIRIPDSRIHSIYGIFRGAVICCGFGRRGSGAEGVRDLGNRSHVPWRCNPLRFGEAGLRELGVREGMEKGGDMEI
jgi:hypothetical protein